MRKILLILITSATILTMNCDTNDMEKKTEPEKPVEIDSPLIGTWVHEYQGTNTSRHGQIITFYFDKYGNFREYFPDGVNYFSAKYVDHGDYISLSSNEFTFFNIEKWEYVIENDILIITHPMFGIYGTTPLHFTRVTE